MMQSVLTLTDRTTALVRPVITGMGLYVKISTVLVFRCVALKCLQALYNILISANWWK